MGRWYSVLFQVFLGVILTACGRHHEDPQDSSDSVWILTEEEKKIYTTPTIYYIPKFKISEQNCTASERKTLKDKDGQTMFSLCRKEFDSCVLQGTCEIESAGKLTLVNVSGKVDGEFRFKWVDATICPYGYGAGRKTCLDPYRSVAADLTLYTLGDVIYLPAALGVLLPDGSLHDGYFVVRDAGGAIKGYGRFDFFTGFLHPRDDLNPFKKLKLAGKNTHLPYFIVQGAESDRVLTSRGYPRLPAGPQ